MPFTEEDNCHEILLKVMLTCAWRRESGAVGPSETDLQVLEDWIQALGLEGPECCRVRDLRHRSIDDFQAMLYDSQLRAALATEGGRDRVEAALTRMLSGRERLQPLELALRDKISSLIGDSSAITRLFEEARNGTRPQTVSS